jgi:hypothetical protein
LRVDAPRTGAHAGVVAALRNAAAATGSDFHYLLGTAMRESSLRPTAQSSTSSAAGLFQFVSQTWLGLVKAHGAQYGLGTYANSISLGRDGRYHADPGMRAQILALRKDPQTSALMAGEYAKSTRTQLQTELGRQVCGGELYAAHFLGADAACRLIRVNEIDPSASAAALFPKAAGANHSVFFHGNGAPKSVGEVYAWAMRQPGGEGTLRLPAAPGQGDLVQVAQLSDLTPPTEPQAAQMAAKARDAQIQMLLMSVMNWQPQGGFSALWGSSAQSQPLSFGPGLLSLLSDARGPAAES